MPDFHAFRVSYGVRNRITHALALAADHRLGEYMHVPATLVAALVKFEVTRTASRQLKRLFRIDVRC